MWRVHGNLDPHREELGWEFCGSRGGAQTELHFTIDQDLRCIPGDLYLAESFQESQSLAYDLESLREQDSDPSRHTVYTLIRLQGALDVTGLNSVQFLRRETNLFREAVMRLLTEPMSAHNRDRVLGARPRTRHMNSSEGGVGSALLNVTVLSWQQVVSEAFFARSK